MRLGTSQPSPILLLIRGDASTGTGRNSKLIRYMPGRLDEHLDRASKVAGILTPILLAVIGGAYTLIKDSSDAKDRRTQDERQKSVEQAQFAQQRYANFSTLLPLLRSKEESDHELALQIFTTEAKSGQAPLELLDVIKSLQTKAPSPLQAAAVKAGVAQQAAQCNTMPEGVYLHIEDKGQRSAAEKIGNDLKAAGFTVRGVQQVDVAPLRTEIRYYPSATESGDLDKITRILNRDGVQDVRNNDISYLLRGCPAKRIYEIWIAAGAQLNSSN